MGNRLVVPVAGGLAIGITLIVLFALFFTQMPARDVGDDGVTLVTIREGANNPGSGNTFEPQVTRVIIGVNNTVRWVNQDSVPHWIEPDDDKNPGFVAATNANDPVGSFIQPNEYLEYTFTQAGEFGYHGKPWMRGTVIVLENVEMPEEEEGTIQS